MPNFGWKGEELKMLWPSVSRSGGVTRSGGTLYDGEEKQGRGEMRRGPNKDNA